MLSTGKFGSHAGWVSPLPRLDVSGQLSRGIAGTLLPTLGDVSYVVGASSRRKCCPAQALCVCIIMTQ